MLGNGPGIRWAARPRIADGRECHVGTCQASSAERALAARNGGTTLLPAKDSYHAL
jgi:hypothetical protein